MTRFAVESGDGCGLLEDTAVRIPSGFNMQNDMAAGLPFHMEPPVIGSRQAKGQQIVILIGTSGQHTPALGKSVFEDPWCWSLIIIGERGAHGIVFG